MKHVSEPAVALSRALRAAGLGEEPRFEAEKLRFFQDRVALVGKVVVGVSAMFLVVAVTDYLRGLHRILFIGRIGHLLATAIALGMWLWLRRSTALSARVLSIVDGFGTLGMCVLFAVMGYFAIQPYGYYTAMLAVTYVSITRAMIVPSEPRRAPRNDRPRKRARARERIQSFDSAPPRRPNRRGNERCSQRPAATAPPRPPAAGARGRDNELNSMLLESLLTRRGYLTELVKSGREAFERLEGRSFDVLLLDLHMPDLDGFFKSSPAFASAS